jgi:hypothetical protein
MNLLRKIALAHRKLTLEQQIPAEKASPKGIIRDLDDWENMVECWHSIRNNLFHGGKNPHERRGQLAVKNGYKTLRPLVEIFLSDEGGDDQFRKGRHAHSDEIDVSLLQWSMKKAKKARSLSQAHIELTAGVVVRGVPIRWL